MPNMSDCLYVLVWNQQFSLNYIQLHFIDMSKGCEQIKFHKSEAGWFSKFTKRLQCVCSGLRGTVRRFQNPSPSQDWMGREVLWEIMACCSSPSPQGLGHALGL